MKRAITVAVVALVGSASAAPASAEGVAGWQSRHYPAPEIHTWRGQEDHTLAVDLWYPAAAGAVEKTIAVPPDKPMFIAGRGARDAALAPAPARLPLILVSHGTGASSSQIAWLASSLARHGYAVAVVNHPGNHSGAPYTVPGFILWWERARDLSIVLDRVLADPLLGPRIDRGRIGAAGFSLGGYTVLELAGARTDRAAFLHFCATHKESRLCGDPPELPGLTRDYPAAVSTPEGKRSLAEAPGSFAEGRVRAVFAIAPAIAAALTGLDKIDRPVAIVAGAADDIVVPDDARHIAASVKNATLEMLPAVGHYTFLAECSDAGRARLPPLCVDGAGVDRARVHQHTAEAAAAFFDRALAPKNQ